MTEPSREQRDLDELRADRDQDGTHDVFQPEKRKFTAFERLIISICIAMMIVGVGLLLWKAFG